MKHPHLIGAALLASVLLVWACAWWVLQPQPTAPLEDRPVPVTAQYRTLTAALPQCPTATEVATLARTLDATIVPGGAVERSTAALTILTEAMRRRMECLHEGGRE